MTAGRPTVATTENVAKAQEYADGLWEERTYGPKRKGWKMIMPTQEDLAEYLGISVDSLKDREEFSGVLEQIKRIQANTLVNGGIIGDLNPVMTKMVLSSKHGYVEKSASEQTVVADVTSNGQTIANPEVAASYTAFLKSQTTKSE